MKPSTRNITKGIGREIKGGAKEAAGAITGNKRLKAEGKVEVAVGKAQRKLGQGEKRVARSI